VLRLGLRIVEFTQVVRIVREQIPALAGLGTTQIEQQIRQQAFHFEGIGEQALIAAGAIDEENGGRADHNEQCKTDAEQDRLQKGKKSSLA
jgi:hypothetical protein